MPAWVWMLIGVALMFVELLATTFATLWFGIAAIVVSVLLYFVPQLSLTSQLVIWISLSVVLCIAWFTYFEKKFNAVQINQSREAIIGQVGMITKAGNPESMGKIRFTLPILGTDEWVCRCQSALLVGERAMVVDILGNELVVKSLL